MIFQQQQGNNLDNTVAVHELELEIKHVLFGLLRRLGNRQTRVSLFVFYSYLLRTP